tara:strand:+ start:1393 stop:1644 length:252 start_codon:yes stop_codon:yes gene_type:complete
MLSQITHAVQGLIGASGSGFDCELRIAKERKETRDVASNPSVESLLIAAENAAGGLWRNDDVMPSLFSCPFRWECDRGSMNFN